MASIFGHFALSSTLSKTFALKRKSILFTVLFLSFLPDLDVLSFSFGIPYSSPYGHRGFSHSILFSLIVAFITVKIYRQNSLKLFILFFLSILSHGLLDAFTNGGLGVAFFYPFDNSRYFFPYQPIQVSPIGVKNFFSIWGLRVLISEIIWIGIPCVLFIGFHQFMKKRPILIKEKTLK